MPACAISPANRREQVRVVGNDLLNTYGRKRFYSVGEVQAAHKRRRIDFDVACWSHAVFNSRADFDAYHRSIGEACNYVAMKAEMLSSVSNHELDSAWFEFDFNLSWLEFPDIDFSIFDFIDF